MKHFTLTLSVAAAALLTLPSLSLADDKPEGKRPGGPGGRPSPEERLKKMTETLGLSQDQQDKIKAIQEKNAPAMKELMAKGRENLTDEDRKQFRELMKSQEEEIEAVLTPDQKEKQAALRKEIQQRRSGG